MSFRSIVQDVRDGFGSLSRRVYSWRRLQGSIHQSDSENLQTQNSYWATLPLELLREIIKRIEASACTWPERMSVVFCAGVCRSWREMCSEIIKPPELSGKITLPVSLKQPGPREGHVQCFIRRDEANSTYYLYLCLSPTLLGKDGKFLLSAKRIRRTTCAEYIISMQSRNISKSNRSYTGKLRSNFLATKFLIYDTRPPYNGAVCSSPSGRSSWRFYSKRVSPKPPSGNFSIAQVTYEPNGLGNRGPRRMNCTMYSIPASSLEAGGTIPGQPVGLFHHSLEDSFRSASFSDSLLEHSTEFSSSRFSDILGEYTKDDREAESKDAAPLVLQNKTPRWHEQLQCWCLNFHGRVTVASVKNFQLIAAAQPASGTPPQSGSTDHEKIILQFGKVGKDTFTMDYRYPLSAFQAFAICLSSFDTKLACE